MCDQHVQRACDLTQAVYVRLPREAIPVRGRARFYGRLYCRIRRAIETEGEMKRAMHDVAWQTAGELVALVRHLLRDEELRDAHRAFYELVIVSLQTFETEVARRDRYLRPSPN